MISKLFPALVAGVGIAAFAAPAKEMPARASITPKSVAVAQFKAPSLAASTNVTLPAMVAGKAAVEAQRPNEPLRVGTVRPLPKSAALDSWSAVEDGFVTRIIVSSEGALGIRAKLEISGVASTIEVRAQGNDGRVEFMRVEPGRSEAWTPWTDGPEQAIEVFSAARPGDDAVRVAALVHFTASPFEKAAAACTLSTQCSTGDSALDDAMAERKKSVARMNWVEGTSAYACTGTLINTERFPQPFFITAHHCIGSQAAASSLTTRWFYEELTCGSGLPNPAFVQLAGGAELIMTNAAVDGTLLRLNDAAPAAAVYAAWNGATLQPRQPVFSISHPQSSTSRWASGVFEDNEARWSLPAMQEFNHVTLDKGFIEGGSSGSGLFTLENGSFVFRGTLLGSKFSDSNPYSCTNLTDADIIYGRFDIFEPQIDEYISNTPKASDDAPNRARDLFNAPFTDPFGNDQPLNERTSTLSLDNRRIDYVGDIDVYRFRITANAWVSTWTEGSQDTIGMILDSRGVLLSANDDWQEGAPYNMGFTKLLTPGTYYVQVAHFEPAGTGTYHLRMRADMVDANYTALWWNAAESGWGLNISHQGDILFGTLYTYGPDGTPAWYSMSAGRKQPDGSYLGDLVSTTGPAFNSSPWNAGAVHGTAVGTMRLAFIDDHTGTLTYNIGAAQVTKAITKYTFQQPPTCTWTASDNSLSSNFQDLWWGGQPESGWGVNLAHQGNIVFATLYTYDAAGKPRWFVMSDGQKTPGTETFTGALYRTTGPPFNAVPFTPITAANNTQVGTMTFAFTDGNSATLTYTVDGASVTKTIHRLSFGAVKPLCKQGS